MRCPNCDFENSIFSAICLRCGASLEVNPSSQETPDANSSPFTDPYSYTNPSVYQEYAEQYQAPTPPPTNGHNRLLSPPPSSSEHSRDETDETAYSKPSQMYGDFKGYNSLASWTATRVIRSIVYFLWAAFGGFGILGALISINDSSALVAVGLLIWLGIFITSIVVFIRLRHRMPRLRFSKFLYYAIIATVLAFVVIIVETALLGTSANILPGLFLGIIFAIYGLVIAVFALW